VAASRKRAPAEEEHENHERWLLTYADMITLLMVLFIVLFAISQVDQKRFEALKEGMAVGFGQHPTPLDGSQALMPEPGTQAITPLKPMSVEGVRPLDADASSGKVQQEQRDRYAEAAAEVSRLEGLRRRIDRALERHGLREDVRMRIDERGLTISLVSRHIVFAPNVADLTARGARVLDVVAPILNDVPDEIAVDGHTNQVKVQPKYYATDWDLSAARAVTVLRYLNEQRGVADGRLSAVAYGHERPLIDPADPRAKVLNKRVDVVVVSSADEATRALFKKVLRDRGQA
jgi:chemotaxis protein MotB